MPKPSEAPQFGPILRAPIQWVKKAFKQWWMSVSESHTNRELLHSWTLGRFMGLILKVAIRIPPVWVPGFTGPKKRGPGAAIFRD
jgi:hypothetical protein